MRRLPRLRTGERLVDCAASLIGYWRPAFLNRDTLKMCWPVRPFPGSSFEPNVSIEIRHIVSDAAIPEWVETMTAAGMPVTAATWAQEFAGRESAHVCGAFDAGRLAGAAGLRAVEGNPDYAYLLWVGVHPAHQGRQIGRALVAHSMQHALASGFRFVMLLTDDHRLPAIKLYLSLGFRPCLSSWDRTQHLRWGRVLRKIAMTGGEYCRDAAHREPASALPR